MDLSKIANLDNTIYHISKKFLILNHLSWPAEEEEKFLSSWRKGNPTLPTYHRAVPNFQSLIIELEDVLKKCDQNIPVEKFLFDTAESYINAGKMLQAIGTKDFTYYSSLIYGRPDDRYENQNITSLDSAEYFLKITDELLGGHYIPKTKAEIDSHDFAGWIRDHIADFFDPTQVDIVLDSTISAKALAGSKKIKISEGAKFSELDKKQLLNHEAFIHTATALNGKNQINLKCLSLGPPRTTRTQEGLAVLSELFTLSMDVTRLRRIALRVIAVKKAMDGANFIELFNYFLEEGQTELDSVRSAQRIFRGGAVKGGIVFTKDSVYLTGLLEIHTFMRLSISQNRPEYIQRLFAGRLTVGDVVRLSPDFESGWLRPPLYVPEWASDFRILAATLAFSSFIGKIALDKIDFERFGEAEEHLRLRTRPTNEEINKGYIL